MTDLLGVQVEVWPVAADEHGIWLVSVEHDAWRSEPIPDDSEPHDAVKDVLRDNPGYPHAAGGAWDAVKLLHSTSWRVDGPAVILTYIAVLGGHHEYVRDAWPDALPIGPDLFDEVGDPKPHGPADVPVPRYADVLFHGVRHLAFLRATDATARAALDAHWRRLLADLEPSLAGMYRVPM